MMKAIKLISTSIFVAILAFALHAYAAVTVRYQNNDSNDYTFDAEIAGSTKKVTFYGSRTGSVTIQGGASSAVIYTKCGKVTVSQGDKIYIKNGCISF
ncbi:hypothetical protein [Flammeovirga aprica]|uniref:DUF3060 domain-containing protein n=1 Tax=Flammeovirga aprica JL-4 TaxID=694437 RepID=A0A7X9RYG9_9BACT|nr:hypothetical protein [Flammeovirga aprica]NME71088.1 hypothetical protein [Flammeovirga aprica JL-4]